MRVERRIRAFIDSLRGSSVKLTRKGRVWKFRNFNDYYKRRDIV